MATVDKSSHMAILAALTRSRTALLFDALPLFSTKSKSKTAPQLVQPAHTITPLSTSTISIGPHSFTRTKLFAVEWTTPIKKKVLPPPPPPPPAPSSSTSITPALIMRLNAASAADPLLASILRKAAAGLASSQELAGLARYIEAMRRDEEATNPTPPPVAPAPPPPPVASTSGAQSQAEEVRPPPSIVIEFRESQNERFILPSHYSFDLLPVDQAGGNNGRRSALLSFFVFPQDKGKGKQRDDGTGQESGAPVPISLVVEDCTEGWRSALLRASRTGRDRDEGVEAWVRKMIAAVPPRVPIVHRPREPTPEPLSPVISRAASFISEAPSAVKVVATPKPKPKRIRNRKAPASSRAKSSSAPATATATLKLEPAPPNAKPVRVRNRPPTKRKPSAKALEAMEMEEVAMQLDEPAPVAGPSQ